MQRIEYEEQVEQIPVQVMRQVSETKTIQVPRTVGRWVAVESTRLVPRVVTMRVPLDGWYDDVIYEGPTTSYSPGTTLPSTTTRKVIIDKTPKKTVVEKPAEKSVEKPSEKSAEKPAESELTPADGSSEAPTPAKPKNGEEPKDTDPTGKPAIDGAKPPEAGLDLNPAAGAAQASHRDRHA